MFIIVNSEGQIWNWYDNRWNDEADSRGQTYAERYTARKAAERVESLQGTMFEGTQIMTYDEWAKLTGGTW